MTVTLETLDLTPAERESCREVIRKLAYCKWLDAGRPAEGQLDFWAQAERQWIEWCYVPHRTPAGRPPGSAPSSAPAAPRKNRRRGRMQARV